MSDRPIFGAQFNLDGTTFRVWTLGKNSVDVILDGRDVHAMNDDGAGYFSLLMPDVAVGTRYQFSIDRGPWLPDIASRWQPDGSDGASVVVDDAFDWTDADWRGLTRRDQIFYEVHIGTFTQEGTWRTAIERLAALKALGVTALQIMPIAAFKGNFGWGYDTTLPYAPYAPYGSPNDVRAFVDAAHGLGLGVILDVVYNHVGVGDYFGHYSDHYFTHSHDNEWGTAFNYDDEGSHAVRDFIVGCTVYWIEKFHFDGLRIDAVQAMFDDSAEHIVAELTRAVRAAAAPRSAYVMVENQPQQRLMIESQRTGGCGVDAMMNDDFHHAAHVAITGHNDFYYRDYLGTPQELASSAKYGFLYQGQRSDMREAVYGTYNLATPAEHFVHFLENHDQVANSARGFRLAALASPARVRAITALLLLGPQTPCLFQGQEFAASNPFLYFHHLEGDEAAVAAKGHRQSLTNFPSVSDPIMQEKLPNPAARATFERSKLDWTEAERNIGMFGLHRDLIALRKREAAFFQHSGRRIDSAVIGDAALVVRYIMPDPSQERLLLLNLGRDLNIGVLAEPLLAPPDGLQWRVNWSSEHPDYDGAGRRQIDPAKFWVLPGDCALVFCGDAPS
ncbi:alpha-amylase family glycosyl hydrolase [Devosia rhodophyticola]|uniref:Malto-oligosyltrehalose trehalohydrolase n=1 Tax=Devosia rhodophyticola TaxID=3026423 RepID=A0ABY7YWX4_9HYPH|nr:alpha-amylase family glycosyl hydrolase [Devosia rhodophyticola]WDR05888.1 alpha-amylase family glycosyl hydrolase [Devosia rhodophyticola]